MTLIVGINLSDRIYLAADTRATIGNNYHDDIFKLAPLPPKIVKSVEETWGHEKIFVAVAGDSILAKYFYKCINKEIQSEKLEYDIRAIQSKLTEEWFANKAKEWVKTTNIDNGLGCALIIGGVEPDRKKVIDQDKVNKLMGLHQEALSKIEDKGIPGMPGITDINKSVTMAPGHYLDFNPEKGIVELAALADTLVMRFEILLNRHRQNGIKFDVASKEWGDFVARGKGITEKDMPESLAVECEFLADRNDQNSAHIISEAIRKFYHIKGIGGPITIHVITKDKSFPMYNPSEIRVIGGQVEIKDSNGKWNPRQSFTHYKGKTEL